MRSLAIRDMEEALDNTRDQILHYRRAGRSVVSISWASPRITDRGDYINIKMIEILRSYYDSGIYIVCSAGNYAMDLDEIGRPRTWVDTLPACYPLFPPPLTSNLNFPIVVSSCDNDGFHYQTSQQAPSYSLSAPGVNIICADAFTVTDVEFSTGTSFCESPKYGDITRSDASVVAAPLVAGVLADFLASGQISKQLDIGDLNELLVRKASWYRGYGSGPPTIWNMIDIEHNKPALTYANASFFNVNASFF
uniref:Peptidase S8/S53 domain-containing protein n=1 Tax=Cladonia uncialis subsp. uncialis TaxID=180999 RepID=A0A2K9YD28_CLAUC|nr:hypothetical protein [Cladonia uncialis subsp. uncialis]